GWAEHRRPGATGPAAADGPGRRDPAAAAAHHADALGLRLRLDAGSGRRPEPAPSGRLSPREVQVRVRGERWASLQGAPALLEADDQAGAEAPDRPGRLARGAAP